MIAVIVEIKRRAAAVARASGAGVVTRDTSAFEDCGVLLIDPWQVSS